MVTTPLGATETGLAAKLGGGRMLATVMEPSTARLLIQVAPPPGGTDIAAPPTTGWLNSVNLSLTINNNLAIAGNLAVDVNKTNTPATNDLVVVTGTLNNSGTGTVKVTNLGPGLSVGDKFTLFSQPLVGGAALTIPPSAGVIWSNTLAVDGSISVVSIIPPPSFATNNPVSRAPNGVVTINATGTVGGTYTLYGSTDLALRPFSAWTVIASGTITTSPFTVTDTSATSLAQRFYIFSTP